ncbi:MAG: YbhN family protein, partial [Planctomycetaceae bacterium]
GFRTVAIVFAAGSAAGLIGLIAMLHTPLFQTGSFQRLAKLRFVGRMIGELIGGVALYRSRPRVIWISVLISIVGHFAMLSSFYFAAMAVNDAGDVPDYFAHLLFMPAAELAGMIPLFPGGLGALEGATGEFYRQAGFDSGDGLLTGIGYRAMTIIAAVLGTGYYLSGRRRVREALEAEPTHDS